MSNSTLEILARSQVTMEICPTSYLPLGLFSALAQVPVTAFNGPEFRWRWEPTIR